MQTMPEAFFHIMFGVDLNILYITKVNILFLIE
jgi:hypothetical protein